MLLESIGHFPHRDLGSWLIPGSRFLCHGIFRHRCSRFAGELRDATPGIVTSYRASLTALQKQMISGEMLLLLAPDYFRIHLFLKFPLDAR